MKEREIKRLFLGAMFVAVAVALSPLSIPVGVAKCFPVQHFVNVIAAMFLGPVYGVGVAFSASLIRVLMGTGTLLAFPGSMVGALLCGIVFYVSKKLWAACLAEIVGTGIFGALIAYPVATLLMGREAALFAFVVPFLASTIGGSAIAFVLVSVFNKLGFLKTALV